MNFISFQAWEIPTWHGNIMALILPGSHRCTLFFFVPEVDNTELSCISALRLEHAMSCYQLPQTWKICNCLLLSRSRQYWNSLHELLANEAIGPMWELGLSLRWSQGWDAMSLRVFSSLPAHFHLIKRLRSWVYIQFSLLVPAGDNTVACTMHFLRLEPCSVSASIVPWLEHMHRRGWIAS